ncbi:hypothetical protein [Paenibacillus pinihumi]|uniref:hypothetical protein n=1 Tax=Paenibacillus pinihumi TaxID=669462 RepID=UPI00040CB8A8|nr:hypothetical protein [Paenibacillus pinihumi]
MKYKDDLSNGYVNGYYVGIRQGGPTQDKLEPTANGYEVPRKTVRSGTVTQDAKQPGYPVPEGGGQDG